MIALILFIALGILSSVALIVLLLVGRHGLRRHRAQLARWQETAEQWRQAP